MSFVWLRAFALGLARFYTCNHVFPACLRALSWRSFAMKLTWLGHSAFRIETGDAIILIDPFLSGNPKFTGDVAKASEGATHIVLSHGHDDHTGDSVEIAKATGAQVVSNFEICMFLNARGIANINPGNTGGTIDCGAFAVSFTQALHSSGTIVDGQYIYLGNPMGIVIKPKEGPSVYHMGDTDIFSDMALINEFHHPKIGLVPVGDRFTMSGKTAAAAVKRYFNFETVVPCHYGTFDLLSPDPSEFLAGVEGSGIKVVVPQIGEAVTF
jgi:L-ascorbate metabolism protein UlaG (beta-lactamase superfamily)